MRKTDKKVKQDKKVEHGTRYAYEVQRCRCEACRAENAAHQLCRRILHQLTSKVSITVTSEDGNKGDLWHFSAIGVDVTITTADLLESIRYNMRKIKQRAIYVGIKRAQEENTKLKAGAR